MRPVLIVLLLILVGCFASEAPRNPMKKRAPSVAPVRSKTPAAAPVKPAKPAKPVAPDEAPEDQSFLDEFGELDRVALMKEMFLLQRDLGKDAKEAVESKDELNARLLKLSALLTQKQMDEFNKWLFQYGVQIERRRKASSKQSSAF